MTGIDFSRMRVLVVEGDRNARDRIVAILEGVGIRQLDTAADSRLAFEALRSFQPDLVVSDVMMEPMDGIAFTRRLRTNRDSPSPHIPVILLAAHTDRTTVIEARDAGVNAFAVKPVTADDMRRKITLVMNDPRRFIQSDDYVGPDRRRRDLPLAGREDRRKGD